VAYYVIVLSFFLIELNGFDTGKEEDMLIIIGILIIISVFFILRYLYYRNSSSRASLDLPVIFSLLTIAAIGQYFLLRQENTIKLQQKIKSFIPLNYRYNLICSEIAEKLGITSISLIGLNGDPHAPIDEMWRYLMNSNSIHVNNTMATILGTKIDDPAVSYDLLWYLSLSNAPYRNDLTRQQRRKVAQMSLKELQTLAGSKYTGPIDRAALIFSILSGQIVTGFPNSLDNNRVQEIRKLTPNSVYGLAFLVNKLINHEEQKYLGLGPYTYLMSLPPSKIEKIIMTMTQKLREVKTKDQEFHRLFQEYSDHLGLGFIHNLELMTLDEKINYLQGELASYQSVFDRASDTPDPPHLRRLPIKEVPPALVKYTNQELITAYEPRREWGSRVELMRVIQEDLREEPRWSISSVGYCNNDETINIITADTHGETDKHDLADPTLSYGVHQNYSCYQASELEASFQESEGAFLFQVPDWRAEARDAQGNPLPNVFTLKSIKELKELLEASKHKYQVKSLLKKVKVGLEFMKSVKAYLANLQSQLATFTSDQRYQLELYLAWMFHHAMWMRFWRGPGYPWIINTNRMMGDIKGVTPEIRDEHIYIQEVVRGNIRERYEGDAQVREFIDNLSTIYYDFSSQEGSCANHPIKGTLDLIALGKHCMGFGSDTVLKTAYYYLVHLLGKRHGRELDNFLTQMQTPLINLERQVIISHLDTLPGGTRRDVMRTRLNRIENNVPQPFPFEPENFRNNIHT
jgi:hypothetical protein